MAATLYVDRPAHSRPASSITVECGHPNSSCPHHVAALPPHPPPALLSAVAVAVGAALRLVG
jgi:hypothetical protein